MLLQDNVILFYLKLLKETRLGLCFETKAGNIFSSLAYNTLRATIGVFFPKSFQSSFPDELFMSLPLYPSIKDLVYDIFDRFLSHFLMIQCNGLLQQIERIYHHHWQDLLWVFFCFISNQENLSMIHHISDLFYNIFSLIKQHNQRQNHYLSLIILSLFDIYKKLIKKTLQ